MEPIIATVQRANRFFAMAVGAALLGCVGFILLDVVLRPLGLSFGGTDEISGYVMAGATSWGMAYTLTVMAHVRIDLLRIRLGRSLRVALDLLSLGLLAVVAVFVAWKGWEVVARSIANDARANTVLETPLWIPQALWWSGWAWFGICAILLWIAALGLILAHRADAAEAIVGTGGEDA